MPKLTPEQTTNPIPETPTDHNGILEGLGSLNRWSQSTISSKDSPISRSRGNSSPSNMESPKADASPASTSSPQRYVPNHHRGQSQGFRVSQPSMPASHTEASKLGSSDAGMIPKFAANDSGMVPFDSNSETSEPVLASPALFQNPWAKSGSLSMDSGEHNLTHDPASSQQVGDSSRPASAKEFGSGRRRRGYSQKAMLSKALQKANTAVLLDNAANFEGAMEAYNDACQLLQLVMLRSNGGEDEKMKLQEIRDTYMLRVTELRRMDFSFREVNSKALPERPLSQESYGAMSQPIEDDDDFHTEERYDYLHSRSFVHDHPISEGSRTMVPNQIPPRRQSLLPSPLEDESRYAIPSPVSGRPTQSDSSRQASETLFQGAPGPPQDRYLTRGLGQEEESSSLGDPHSELTLLSTHARDIYESTSWLDTIDESGASSPSSLHSRVSSVYLRRRRSHRFSHGTEAEFDAALDAAVEAAYDEGLEPAVEVDGYDTDDEIVANARRNVELAKQRVREAEREAEVAITQGQELRHIYGQTKFDHSSDLIQDYPDDDDEAEEEERLLDEMTSGYVMDDFAFDLQSKSALPRQSDSSVLSGRTWESSVVPNSTTTTPGVTLSPLEEDDVVLTDQSKKSQSALTPLELDLVSSPHVPSGLPNQSSVPTASPSVRARRMSGQNLTELKIETSSHPKVGGDVLAQESADTDTFRPHPVPKDVTQTLSSTSSSTKTPALASVLTSAVHLNRRNASIASLAEDGSTTEVLEKVITQEGKPYARISKVPSPARLIGKVPSAPDNLGKLNSGLKTFRPRNVSVPAPDLSANSPETPSSGAFPDIHKGTAIDAVPSLPTPIGATFAPSGMTSGGLYLFDSHIHSPTSPGSPNPMAANAPIPLEPCPESFLLRPFWLMRCIYQTIAHPRGGYLSTKLFVPHDVWGVKNVKLRAVEEKVSNCDLLTAALLKLAKVDTYDADAVLEEMQSLEAVLDQVQVSLSKKISSEVGVQGALPLFKYSQSSEDAANGSDNMPQKVNNGSSKSSYLTSWRKLRSKNSGFGAPATPVYSKETSKDNLTISSLPMTSLPTSQTAKRATPQFQFSGPNANYMAALARLCDAAQVLDQIAQQVEDPGLKHSSPTLVGLELSTRHAAEFFGFYICRFALNDIGMMLDKFIKRGSEWVLI
ncbi:uncharacterized protein CDV56_107542 [Aspergillus thermomutatus]|uniref:MIT domain-containing protein n=1 Tax=Aspergillus thermomutatus TaxID=41047 RepID=A0A397H5X3_ASPTH|nr:uncharacterized protein CDV56_107542 [Aspergillus thermomutatus]RHZ58475.1 hypothetical protein CDV56_107542 [Aspergillus thermomutatus]